MGDPREKYSRSDLEYDDGDDDYDDLDDDDEVEEEVEGDKRNGLC